MKHILRCAAILAVLALGFSLASCKNDVDDDEPTMYTVTVSSSIEHGKVSVDKTSAEAGATIKLTATAADGYELEAFSAKDASANALTVTNGTFTMPKSNVTVSATFKEKSSGDGTTGSGNTGDTITCTVTFTTNGGTEVAAQKIKSGEKATEPTAPTKDGYTFDGWFTDSGFTTAFSFSSEITADITLYAKWIDASKPTFTVTFSVDGATTTQTVEENAKATKPTDPTKNGYTFTGWYNGDSKFEFDTAITANVTLTAKWELITYKITYAGLDGATNPNTATTYTIETDDITLTDASKTGYTFGGWKNANGDAITKIIKGSTGDLVLTAQWTPSGIYTENSTYYIGAYSDSAPASGNGAW